MNSTILKILLLLFAQQLFAAEEYTGFHVAGLPNVSYKDGEGFAAGGNLYFFQYGDGHPEPYRWNTIFALKMSTEGMISTYAFLDIPHLFGPSSRFNFYIEVKRYLVDDFYGLGNNPDYNLDVIDPNKTRYKDKFYYSFKQQWPGIILSAQLPSFIPNFRHILGLGYYSRSVESYPTPNKLAEEKPLGYKGGTTTLLQYGLVYDTRDQEAVPQSGAWSDVLLEYAAPLLGSTYEYLRLTLTDRRYFLLLPRVVYAHRLLVEPIFGAVPFYDMAVINGSYERHLGLGGSSSLRGIPRLLFVGQHKALANFELRFETLHLTVLRQDFTFYLHTFADVGRVWLKDDPITFDNVHSSYGLGLHVRWKKDLVGAIDIGRSKYSDMAVYVTFRNLF